MRPTHELVQSLISTHSTIDAKMASSRVTLFTDSKPLGSDFSWQGLGVVYVLELLQKILDQPRLKTMELNKHV